MRPTSRKAPRAKNLPTLPSRAVPRPNPRSGGCCFRSNPEGSIPLDCFTPDSVYDGPAEGFAGMACIPLYYGAGAIAITAGAYYFGGERWAWASGALFGIPAAFLMTAAYFDLT